MSTERHPTYQGHIIVVYIADLIALLFRQSINNRVERLLGKLLTLLGSWEGVSGCKVDFEERLGARRD